MSKGKMRAATSFLRTLSRLPTARQSAASSVVAPLPEQSRFSEEVTAKLDTLGSSENEYTSASWLVDVLDATIVAQKVAQECVVNNVKYTFLSKLDKEKIENYLEGNIDLLDACNGLVEKIELVHKYVNSLQASIIRLNDQEMFKECNKLEAQCVALDKCGPKLSKLMGRKETQHFNNKNNGEQDVDELQEALSGSREVASMGCHLLQRALSFKSRQGLINMKSKLATTWSSSLNELQVNLKRKKSAPWMMYELEKLVMDVRVLQGHVKSQKGVHVDVGSLRRSCKVLEEVLKPLEEKVKDLYRHLISFRMVLLGILSNNCNCLCTSYIRSSCK